MRITTPILLVAIASLAGCNDADKGQQSKSVGWFLDHREELAMALKACRDNPGAIGNTPNCINANEARNQVTVQEMENALK